MRLRSVRIHCIDIPFTFGFTHASASRHRSDSLILELSGTDGRRSHTGYGEAVSREYVTGSLHGVDDAAGTIEAAAACISGLLDRFTGADFDIRDVIRTVRDLPVATSCLPLLCSLETAFLDMFCSASGADVYDLLGLHPLRESVTYGGIIPFFSRDTFMKYLHGYRKAGIRSLRIKVGNDPDYNRDMLSLARRFFGDGYDIRVDVNGAWNPDTVTEHLAIMKETGVTMVEEPIGRDRDGMKRMVSLPEADGITFIADESCLTAEDIDTMAADGTFGMVNLRLTKNGGLHRCLDLAEAAASRGIAYQLASLVGETGILSAAGRVAASLLPEPRYVEGSFDSYLLSGNITTENIDFGPGGVSPVIRGNGLGYTVDPAKLERYSVNTRRII